MEQNSEINEPVWLGYRPGATDSKGNKIGQILHHSRLGVVYRIEGEPTSLISECNNKLVPQGSEIISIAKVLLSRARSLFTVKRYETAKQLVIAGLGKAFLAKGSDDAVSHFREAEDFLSTYLDEKLHFNYLLSALCATIFSIIPPICYATQIGKDQIYHVLVGGTFGAIGAFVFTLFRFHQILIPKYATWRTTTLGSLTRVFSGAIFGSVFIIFQKAGLILNIVSANVFLLYTFAFVSGYLERFVPDIVEKLQSNVSPTIPK